MVIVQNGNGAKRTVSKIAAISVCFVEGEGGQKGGGGDSASWQPGGWSCWWVWWSGHGGAPIPSPRGQEAEQTVCGVAGFAHNHGCFSGDVCVFHQWGGAPMIYPAVFTMRCSAFLLYSVQLPPQTVMQLNLYPYTRGATSFVGPHHFGMLIPGCIKRSQCDDIRSCGHTQNLHWNENCNQALVPEAEDDRHTWGWRLRRQHWTLWEALWRCSAEPASQRGAKLQDNRALVGHHAHTQTMYNTPISTKPYL